MTPPPARVRVPRTAALRLAFGERAGGGVRPTRWMLIGLLVIGGVALSSDADEQKSAEGPQATHFERLLKRHPNDPALHYNLGTARYLQGHYDKAAESLKHAVASSDSSLQGRASYNLGNTHYRLGRAAEHAAPNQAIDFYQKALEDYRFAIRQDPKDADAKYNYELVDQHLKALKTVLAQQQSAKTQQQQAQGEQTTQEQNQQVQAQQQTEQAGESPQQPQQAASAESKSEPESTSSTEAAQGTDQQHQGQSAKAQQQQPGQQGSEHNAQTATEPQNMSQQHALWILDTLKSEERGALVKEHQHSAHEADVEQDW